MASASSFKTLGNLARLAGRRLNEGRLSSAVWKAALTTARSTGQVLHQLWLEVTGFVFLFIASFGALGLAREYPKYQSTHNSGRLIVAICFTLVFGWFGISSFWRVKKKRRN